MTLKKEISIDSIVGILSVFAAAAILYARLCVLESNFNDTKDRVKAVENKVEEHDKSIVELKTLVRAKIKSQQNSDSN